MKKLVTFILIIILSLIFNLNLIYAINNSSQATIILSYPSQVNFGQEFSVNVTLINFPDDVYDVRIGVINDSIRLARIWNGNNWQSAYYYINNVFNTTQKKSESFRLNMTACCNGNANLEIKLRDSKNYVYSFYNYSINVMGNCPAPHISQNQTDNTIDDTDNEIDDTDNDIADSEISLNLDWNSENIRNGKDFEISINAYNLQDKDYDLKVFIYGENENKPISQIYNDGKWVNSNNYLIGFFKGGGDKTEDVKLRIKESFRSFNGEATIGVRLREKGTSVYKKEIQATIDILEADESADSNGNENSTSSDSDSADNSDNSDNQDNIDESNNKESLTQYTIDEEVVHNLTPKTESIKTKENIVFKSKNELIKIYSIFAFVILIMIFFVLLFFYRYRKK